MYSTNDSTYFHLYSWQQVKSKTEWERLKNYRKGALPPYSLAPLPLTPSDSPSFLRHSVLPLIPMPYGITFSVLTPNSSTSSSHTLLLPLPTLQPKRLSFSLYLISLSSSTMLKRYSLLYNLLQFERE